MLTVTISTCERDSKTWVSYHRTDNHEEALARAVQRRWGKNAFFSVDQGISARTLAAGTQYGQIFEPVRVGNGSTSRTGRINVRVEEAPKAARAARLARREAAAVQLGRSLALGWWTVSLPETAPETLTLAVGDFEAIDARAAQLGLRNASRSNAGPAAREWCRQVEEAAQARWAELRAGGA